MNNNIYKPQQKIFCEEKITHPFFNQACADVLKKSFDWFSKSEISNTDIKNQIGLSKDELINATEYVLKDIMRINSERLNKLTAKTVFYHRPVKFEWVTSEIMDSSAKICFGYEEVTDGTTVAVGDREYLTEYGENYIYSLYRTYDMIASMKKNLIPPVHYISCILFNIYKYGHPKWDW